ncbi:molybdenum cofactor biosynthesis protein B [Halovenus sp. WSH3]|uniref:Molybdenum cofactor biosynthesis protein B n=1 Tax=Halovenus carboxidivorans TaxID=2692199 RepID=A0A6B0T9E0_9EURY|nr:molybdopterin-binding protein [Halovenus carboxidivorans]MXR51972.1 molybdenum cofactor biosynthesis protein B [Halovenus carboxidivorans]
MVDFQSREPRTRTEDEDSDSESADADGETAEEETEQAASEAQPDEQVAYAVVTVTDDRSLGEDTQGDTVVEVIEQSGATVVTRDLIQPSYDGIQNTLATLAERRDVDIVVTIGGTGVEPDDVTVDALDRLFEKRLPGFGELFRRLAYDQHGTGVVGTRTTAGVIDGAPVFAVPGTIDGAVLATEEIIIPEAPALAEDASMQSSDTAVR